MTLPINIQTLLGGGVVEWARIELKETWDPQASLKTICAFANDVDNWGGGYLIIGVSDNGEGKPAQLKGVPDSKIDAYLKDMLNKCKLIQPSYIPITEVAEYKDKKFIVVWAPGGSVRPYSSPKVVTGGKSERVYWIRKMASTIAPSEEEKRELYNLANNVPFDDRVNHSAELSDLSVPLIKSYLKEVNSSLYPMVDTMDLADLCRSMNIADGPDEYIKPKNVGLLFFSMDPEKWFPYAHIDVVELPDGEGGDRLFEHTFAGPVDQQLREALRYIQNSIIEETVIKRPDVAEAERHFNYPYAAIEEALSNAVYHKGYDSREPIEVRVLPDRIEILSHPGADRSITIENLMQYRAVSRRYRNRRVGDFLKELHLTEGRNTGFHKILHALEVNDSPAPRFETDEDRIYFLTTLFAWRSNKAAGNDVHHARRGYAGASGIAARRNRVLAYFAEHPEATLLELCNAIGITKSMADRDVKALKQDGRLKREGSSFAGYWRVLN